MAISSPPQALPSTLDLNQVLVILIQYQSELCSDLENRQKIKEQNQSEIRTKHDFRR